MQCDLVERAVLTVWHAHAGLEGGAGVVPPRPNSESLRPNAEVGGGAAVVVPPPNAETGAAVSPRPDAYGTGGGTRPDPNAKADSAAPGPPPNAEGPPCLLSPGARGPPPNADTEGGAGMPNEKGGGGAEGAAGRLVLLVPLAAGGELKLNSVVSLGRRKPACGSLGVVVAAGTRAWSNSTLACSAAIAPACLLIVSCALFTLDCSLSSLFPRLDSTRASWLC